ncbi:helix-turn-helix domain-containing protein [Litorivita pollutaquae]|uniref:Helix-turn-helix domain-containing protein n=2 Tax=Litorivita pollutaquae TaxID=2200892 RepID=A0A2V4MSY6_9RHOB|nr:helix-turn-helix domain-containing protein [Litorivita pollutaquae]
MTARELRELVGVSHMTINRWLKDGKLGMPQPVRIRGQRYFPVTEIQTWLEGQRG